MVLSVMAGLGYAPVASEAVSLTITPITWNVVGLDSNKTTSGPNRYPVGVRVCNTGDVAAANAAATFTWDSTNANIALSEGTAQTIGTLAAGTCSDVYWTAVITRSAAR